MAIQIGLVFAGGGISDLGLAILFDLNLGI